MTLRSAAALAALALLPVARALAGAPAGPSASDPAAGVAPADAAGTYRLTGSAHLAVAPFPERQEPLHADAVLSRAGRSGAVRLALAVDDFRCTLRGRLDPAGALTLRAGQRCPVALPAGAEGRAEAVLSSGVGTARDGALEIALTFQVSGRVRLQAGGALEALGGALALPGTGGRFTDLAGPVQGRAAGRRDASRAAEAEAARAGGSGADPAP